MKMRVKDFEDYELDTETGTLFSYKANRNVGSLNKKTGYIHVGLHNDKGQLSIQLHILMAQQFLPNPENKPTVNHKNHDRTDNRLENLEWSTYEEQQDDITVSKRLKPVRVFKEGFSKIFSSGNEASEVLGLSRGHLSSVLTGKRNSTGGYRAEYVR